VLSIGVEVLAGAGTEKQPGRVEGSSGGPQVGRLVRWSRSIPAKGLGTPPHRESTTSAGTGVCPRSRYARSWAALAAARSGTGAAHRLRHTLATEMLRAKSDSGGNPRLARTIALLM